MLEDNPNRTGIGVRQLCGQQQPGLLCVRLYGETGQNAPSRASACGSNTETLKDAVGRLRGSQMSNDGTLEELAGAGSEAPDSDANLAQSDAPALVVSDEFTSGGNTLPLDRRGQRQPGTS
ncbi:MAG: hypothetical protein R2849_09630 [Thermomicrobiales bacterium]